MLWMLLTTTFEPVSSLSGVEKDFGDGKLLTNQDTTDVSFV